MEWASRVQTNVMSSVESCDAAHCMWVLSPTVTSALEGAKVILVASGEKKIKGVSSQVCSIVLSFADHNVLTTMWKDQQWMYSTVQLSAKVPL